MHRLQYTAVLVILCAFAGVVMAEAHRCIHHELVKRQNPESLPLSVAQEVPDGKRDGWQAHSAEESDWAPIRIGVSTIDLLVAKKYCTIVGETKGTFLGGSVECSERDILTEAKRTFLTTRILPSAIQLHRDRLLVKPVTGSIVVPRFPNEHTCSMFSIPEAHFVTGVSGMDMILYVAAAPTNGVTLAWSYPCAQNADGRPVFGVINFGPHSVEKTSMAIRVAAHEIAHALGFNFVLFRQKGIVSDARSVRGKNEIFLVKSSKTLEKTREHFGCPTAEGMELEDEGEGTQLEHWERRNAKDELMAGISGLGVYSALTMAAFEDLGFYRANWGMEEPMVWGRNKGCDLLTKPCVSNGNTAFPDMFCTSVQTMMTCTSDRRGLGNCRIEKYETPLPPQFRYSEDPTMGGAASDLTDFCPINGENMNALCATGDPNWMAGSVVGPHSRCMNGRDLRTKCYVVSDICADVSCQGDGTVLVRYLGDPLWYRCADGLVINPKTTFSGGRILCPRYEEVCVA